MAIGLGDEEVERLVEFGGDRAKIERSRLARQLALEHRFRSTLLTLREVVPATAARDDAVSLVVDAYTRAANAIELDPNEHMRPIAPEPPAGSPWSLECRAGRHDACSGEFRHQHHGVEFECECLCHGGGEND